MRPTSRTTTVNALALLLSRAVPAIRAVIITIRIILR